MTVDDRELMDPDVYAAELQDCLLSEGPRSYGVRYLRRLARQKGNAELERIFEMKVGALQRYTRESRVPSIWNLPIRWIEWIADNFRFTPHRDMWMTVLYVLVALLAVDAIRPRFQGSPEAKHNAKTEANAVADDAANPGDDRKEKTVERPQVENLNAWLIEKINQSMQASEVETLLSERVDAAVDEILASEEFQKELRRKVSRQLGVAPSAETPADALGREESP